MAFIPPSSPASPSPSTDCPASSSSSATQSSAKVAAVFNNARNLRKAWVEHKMLIPFDDTLLAYTPSPPPLDFSYNMAYTKGAKNFMEDYVALKTDNTSIIAGIFDGHGGEEAAQFASSNFSSCFFSKLKESPDDVKKALTDAMRSLHQMLIEAEIDSGTTACVLYIYKRDNTVYIATLGDSEAKLYRKKEGSLHSIPLSCVRNWASPKDIPQELFFHGKPIEPATVLKDPESYPPKFLRNLGGGFGINVSRALGDYPRFTDLKQKPKVTGPIQLRAGDTLLICSDGVWDYVLEKELVDAVILPFQKNAADSLAAKVVQYACEVKSSMDNISAIAINCREKK